jgi:competence protein ComEA
MWQSFVIKLGMLAATMGVVFWIGWTVPSTVTRSAQGGAQSDPGTNSGPPSTGVSPPVAASSAQTDAASSGPGTTSSVGGKQERARLDLNRASAQEFEELPGIGPVLAERIIDYRKSGKTFRTVDDLRAVKGIGQKKFDRIRALVTVTPTISRPERGKKAA